MFSHERKSSQESHSDREGISLAHRAVRGENEALSRLSESEMTQDSFLKNKEISCSQRQNLKYGSKNAEQTFLTVPFVYFKDKFIPVVWRLTIPIWHLEESWPDFTKNWRSEKERFENLILKVSTRWKN